MEVCGGRWRSGGDVGHPARKVQKRPCVAGESQRLPAETPQAGSTRGGAETGLEHWELVWVGSSEEGEVPLGVMSPLPRAGWPWPSVEEGQGCCYLPASKLVVGGSPDLLEGPSEEGRVQGPSGTRCILRLHTRL